MPAMDYSRVAGLYDLYANTDISVPVFLQETQGSQSVLELRCGTGRLSSPSIEVGVRLACLDGLPEMLERLTGGVQLSASWMAGGWKACRPKRVKNTAPKPVSVINRLRIGPRVGIQDRPA
jgi:hypothetical protein